MPTAEQKERLVDSAVKVTAAYNAYVAELARNQDIEQDSLTWPVVDILECATEARRRVGKEPRSEDELLTIFEQMIPNIRQQYAEERRAQLDALNEKFLGPVRDSGSREGKVLMVRAPIEIGPWDYPPEDVT